MAIGIVLLLVCMQAGMAVNGPAAADASGFKFLAAGDYAKALQCFNIAARENPDSSEVHFGRATALSNLGRKDEALKEYKLALLLNPGRDLKKKLESGLTLLQANCNKTSANVSAQPALSGAALEAEHSIGKIMSQSEDRINGIHTSAEKFASNLYSGKLSQQKKIMEAAKQEADILRNNARWRSGMSFADINEYEADIRRRSGYILNKARSDYDNHRREAQMRAHGIKDSAEGLQKQMLEKPSETSGVFLLPKGTNLYVRNYGHFDPVMPEHVAPTPLSAVPLKLPEVLRLEQKHKKK
ncbi:MAG: tetratricopeptide repeat protein [Candidatus Obscuribacterales bacterium]|nr:tetratricopeptide repeat protein [Candidatus Obscuribacterales bacterium]